MSIPDDILLFSGFALAHAAYSITASGPDFRHPEGQRGTPGKVSVAILVAAISGTSINSNGVAARDTGPADPPTLVDYEAMRSKLSELINPLRQ